MASPKSPDARAATRQVLHSAETDDHGTPHEYVELARETQGGIDLDPTSSAYWNHHVVKAARFYDQRMNGIELPYFGRMIFNPPGGKSPLGVPNVRRGWERLIEHYRDGRVESCVWIGFSLEQLTYLQSAPMHPLQFLTLVPCDRLEFLQRPTLYCAVCLAEQALTSKERQDRRRASVDKGPCQRCRQGNGPPVKGQSPVHGNYITLLPSRRSPSIARDQSRIFVERASRLDVSGAIVRPL